MARIKYRSPKWKVVENARTVTKICPRCNNNVDFVLVYDKTGIGFFDKMLITTKTHYALHCPICLYYDDILKSVCKNLIG